MNALSTHLHAKREFRRAKRAPSLSPRRARALSAHWWLSAHVTLCPLLFVASFLLSSIFVSVILQMASQKRRVVPTQLQEREPTWDSS